MASLRPSARIALERLCQPISIHRCRRKRLDRHQPRPLPVSSSKASPPVGSAPCPDHLSSVRQPFSQSIPGDEDTLPRALGCHWFRGLELSGRKRRPLSLPPRRTRGGLG